MRVEANSMHRYWQVLVRRLRNGRMPETSQGARGQEAARGQNGDVEIEGRFVPRKGF